MADDVVQIGVRPKRFDPDRTLEAVVSRKCRHPRFAVDESMNEVECSACGVLLNPIWVLGQLANQESALAVRRTKLKALVRKLSDRLKYKCRSCGKMNDMSRIVKVSPREFWNEDQMSKTQKEKE